MKFTATHLISTCQYLSHLGFNVWDKFEYSPDYLELNLTNPQNIDLSIKFAYDCDTEDLNIFLTSIALAKSIRTNFYCLIDLIVDLADFLDQDLEAEAYTRYQEKLELSLSFFELLNVFSLIKILYDPIEIPYLEICELGQITLKSKIISFDFYEFSNMLDITVKMFELDSGLGEAKAKSKRIDYLGFESCLEQTKEFFNKSMSEMISI